MPKKSKRLKEDTPIPSPNPQPTPTSSLLTFPSDGHLRFILITAQRKSQFLHQVLLVRDSDSALRDLLEFYGAQVRAMAGHDERFGLETCQRPFQTSAGGAPRPACTWPPCRPQASPGLVCEAQLHTARNDQPQLVTLYSPLFTLTRIFFIEIHYIAT